MKKGGYRLVMLLCIGVMIFSGYQLFKIVRSYRRGTTAYQKTASAYTRKSNNTRVPISVDFDALKRQNPDVIGWLYCQNTPINYPVVKGDDNSEYLHKLFDGTRNAAGTLFADSRSKGDFSDPNTIIYGHAMKNGSMFGTLAHYKKADYYKAHPFMWLLTPNGNYRLDLIAGFTTASNNMIYSAMDNGQVQAAIYQGKKKSTFTSTADTSQIPRIVTLSTCAYEYEEARYVVLTVPVRVD